MTRDDRRAPRTDRRARAGVAVAALLAVLLSLVGIAPSVADPGAEQTTVTGVVEIAVVDHGEAHPAGAAAAAAPAGGTQIDPVSGLATRAMVVVDGRLVGLPDAQRGSLVGGEAVTLTLEAPAGTSRDEALAGAVAGTVPVTAVERARAVDLPVRGLAAAVPAGTPTGAHTVTVLPVHWGTPDTTVSALATMATETAQFWLEQSSGSMVTTTSVREWTVVAPPTACDTGGLYAAAMAANPDLAPASQTNHVVIYFPQIAACGGWVGLASLNGGRVWINGLINGSPATEVLAHEVGHNLGLGHANQTVCTTAGVASTLGDCTVQEYADRADVMGYAIDRAPGNLNTALAARLGYVQSVTASRTATVTADLVPLGQASGVRAVRVPLWNGDVLWVDYRPAVGRDTRYSAWAGVQVHRALGADLQYWTSQLVDMQPAATAAATSTVAAAVGTPWSVPGSDYVLTVVSVTGTAARVQVAPKPAGSVGFLDVPVTHRFFTEISWLATTGVTTGYADGTFGGAFPVTRAAMAAFLYRFDGQSGPAPATASFTDVPFSHPFFTEIGWLATSGVTTGYPDGSFGTSRAVSRAAMAAFLYRLAGYRGVDVEAFVAPAVADFSDVPTDHPFYTEISWLASTGITTGYADRTFGPGRAVSREAMAAFLYRFDQAGL